MHDLNQLHNQIRNQENLIHDQKIMIEKLKEQETILRRTILFYENRKILSLSNS